MPAPMSYRSSFAPDMKPPIWPDTRLTHYLLLCTYRLMMVIIYIGHANSQVPVSETDYAKAQQLGQAFGKQIHNQISMNPSILPGVLPSPTTSPAEHFKNGQGNTAKPSLNKIANCRLNNAVECQAIQILLNNPQKDFSLRPSDPLLQRTPHSSLPVQDLFSTYAGCSEKVIKTPNLYANESCFQTNSEPLLACTVQRQVEVETSPIYSCTDTGKMLSSQVCTDSLSSFN